MEPLGSEACADSVGIQNNLAGIMITVLQSEGKANQAVQMWVYANWEFTITARLRHKWPHTSEIISETELVLSAFPHKLPLKDVRQLTFYLKNKAGSVNRPSNFSACFRTAPRALIKLRGVGGAGAESHIASPNMFICMQEKYIPALVRVHKMPVDVTAVLGLAQRSLNMDGLRL